MVLRSIARGGADQIGELKNLLHVRHGSVKRVAYFTVPGLFVYPNLLLYG